MNRAVREAPEIADNGARNAELSGNKQGNEQSCQGINKGMLSGKLSRNEQSCHGNTPKRKSYGCPAGVLENFCPEKGIGCRRVNPGKGTGAGKFSLKRVWSQKI